MGCLAVLGWVPVGPVQGVVVAVSNNFQANTLDLDGKVSLFQPTALDWGPDGRLYVTEVDGGVKVLTIAFGDKPDDGVSTAKFYVTAATTVPLVKGAIQNHNDNGAANAGANRQVTGIDVTQQFDASGNPMKLANGAPMVTMYVTSSDSRIGAGGGGADIGLDTNSGVITKLVQTGANSWTAVDIVRGLPRSEENHATNGLEVIQEIGPDGKLISERMIVAQGGNANSGAPSYNFAGQQEQPLSGAILEVNLDMLKAMPVKFDGGRAYIYDLPTLNDPTRTGNPDASDPFGGNDGLNSAVLAAGGPIKVYSAGYRNSYDVEVTDDGRVWTYDNGANNSWGGRPVGEAGDNGGAIDLAQALGYIATNLNNGEGNVNDGINLVNWNPANKDNFHEVTRSDDLAGRTLSAGQGGAQTYVQEGLVHVYGGHPNPTRAEGSRAGMLFTPGAGTDNAFLMVSNQDSFGNGGGSDYAEVIGWLTAVENNNAAFPSSGIYGAAAGALTKKVLAVTPGVAYDIYALAGGAGAAVVKGGPAPAGGVFLGTSGLPADIANIVPTKNPIEGDYKEGGKTDGALDSGNGSINGLTEYTSTILDDGAIKMKGAIIAANLNGGSLIVMGRNADGSMSSMVQNGFAVASDRTTLNAGGGPLGLTSLGDDVAERGLAKAFQGSIWVATYNQNGPLIEVFQPANGKVPLAGQQIVNTTDHDLDGVGHIADPFEFSAANGYAIAPGQSIVIDFNPQNANFPTSIAGTGLLGAALDGVTPNRDAQTAFENYPPSQQLDGLYDIGGNVLPGGNAPILQIKKVAPGSVVGAANTARDVLHTGVKPSADVSQIVASMTAKNWIPAAGGVKDGQLTGMIFGDGTQANFLRVVFGSVNGAPGFEVGYELGNANYTKLATIATPGLSSAAVSLIELRLTLDSKTFAVAAAYKLEGQAGFTSIDLKGFVLPPGVLRDVLTGAHTIGAAPGQASGAAIGFLAETSPSNPLEAVDFYSLRIEAFGNQILATTGSQVGAPGSAGIDTLVYTGVDTVLAPLAGNVENFDGSGSAANYAVMGNALGNVVKVGSGANTVTTGGGADTVVGTLAQLAGDTITDFSAVDAVMVSGAVLSGLDISYGAGPASLILNGQALKFTGDAFAGFTSAAGPATFAFAQTADGVKITLNNAGSGAETVLYRVNAGSGGTTAANASAGSGTIAALDGGPAWLGDAALIGATGPISVTGAGTGVYTQALSNQVNEIEAGNVDLAKVPWQLFVNERNDPVNDATKLAYNFAVEAGKTYKITLYYSENWPGVFAFEDSTGQTRQFDVTVEGQLLPAFTDINPIMEAVAKIGAPLPPGSASNATKQPFLGMAFEKSATYTATDGTLTVAFEHDIQNPKINAIQISQIGGQIPPPPPPPVITVADASAGEGGVATVAFNRSGDLAQAVTIGFQVIPGTASAADYVAPATQTVTIPAGAGSASIAIPIIDDTLPEGAEVFNVNITSATTASGPATVADGSATVTIASSDLPPPSATVVARWNAGTATVAAIDGGPNWTAGTAVISGGPTKVFTGGITAKHASVAASAPMGLFAQERWDPATGAEMSLDFGAGLASGAYAVRLFLGNAFGGTSAVGQRVFDIAIEGALAFDDVDPAKLFGHATGGMLEWKGQVTDGVIDIDFARVVDNPLINAVEILKLDDAAPPAPVAKPTLALAAAPTQASEAAGTAIVLTVTASAPVSGEQSVSLILGGQGVTQADFATPVPPAVIIPSGQTKASVTLVVADDTLVEGGETAVFTLANPSSGVALGGVVSASVSIADNDAPAPVVIHRWNAGTATVEAIDGGPAWTAETSVIKGGPTKVFAGGVATTHGSVAATTPSGIFAQERWDPATGDEMALAFGGGGLAAGDYAIRLFLANGYAGTAAPGARVFDIFIEDQIVFNDVDPSALFGHQTGGMLEWRGAVSDGTIDIGFTHGIDNPLINGVEILALGDALLV